jgi:hypothetical protein
MLLVASKSVTSGAKWLKTRIGEFGAKGFAVVSSFCQATWASTQPNSATECAAASQQGLPAVPCRCSLQRSGGPNDLYGYRPDDSFPARAGVNWRGIADHAGNR